MPQEGLLLQSLQNSSGKCITLGTLGSLQKLQENYRLLTQGSLREASLQPHRAFYPLW